MREATRAARRRGCGEFGTQTANCLPRRTTRADPRAPTSSFSPYCGRPGNDRCCLNCGLEVKRTSCDGASMGEDIRRLLCRLARWQPRSIAEVKEVGHPMGPGHPGSATRSFLDWDCGARSDVRPVPDVCDSAYSFELAAFQLTLRMSAYCGHSPTNSEI